MLYHRRVTLASLIWLLVAVALALPARGQTLIRDPDIEYGLNVLARPILQAAGLSPNQVRILLIKDSSFNAFVLDHQHIFLHTGLVLKMTRPEMLQAVIAHETAHIANGHLARRMANLRSARNAANMGLALAIAAGAAGANSEAVTGLAIGTSSTATRLFLAHTRAEEASADQSAIRYMLRAKVDPRAAVEVHDLFRGQEALAASRQDPYMRSHPLTRERARAMQAFVNANACDCPTNPDAAYWFARSKDKLSAFTRNSNWTLRRLDRSATRDIALMREAIAYHRRPDARRALSAINKAVAMRPNDPFLHELKGQILLESRDANGAITAYARAANLAPRNALILGGLGRAYLAAGQHRRAMETLERARSRDFRDARILRDLAQAYARMGKPGMASVATAERYALVGRLDDAAIHAKRAVDLLPQGSGPWQRAQDVLRASEAFTRRRNRG